MKKVITIVLLFTLVYWGIQYNKDAKIAPDLEVAHQYVSTADSLFKNRNLEGTLPLLKEACLIYHEHESWVDWISARKLMGEAYRNMGRLEEASDLLEQTITLGSTKLGKNHDRVIWVKIVQSSIVYSLGDYDLAIKIVEDLLPLIDKLEDSATMYSMAYAYLGIFLERKKEYDKALEYSLKGLALQKTMSKNDGLELATSQANVAGNYIMLDEYEQAIIYLNRSLKIRSKVFQDDSHPRLVIIYNNLGICYGALGDTEKAEAYFLKGISIDKKTYGEIHPAIASSLWNMGMFYEKYSNDEKALAVYQEELNIRKEIEGGQIELAENYNRLGNVHRALNNIEASLKFQNQAFEIVAPGFIATNAYALPALEDVVYKAHGLKYGLAKLKSYYLQVENKKGKRQASEAGLATGELCLHLWRELRHELEGQDKSKQENSHLTATSVKYASLLTQNIFKETGEYAYAEKTWKLMEEGKSLTLFKAYRDAGANPKSSLPNRIRAREDELSKLLAAYDSQLLDAMRENNKEEVIKIKNELIFDTKRDYDQLINEIAEKAPEYYHLKYNTTPIPIRNVQSVLATDQVLLEYMVQHETGKLLIFIIEKGQPLVIKEMPLPKNILAKTTTFWRLLDSYQLSRSKKRQQFISLSNELYELLLTPVESYLTNKKKLVVIGEDFINYIPFEVLLPSAEDGNFTDLNFLIRHFEISYHYSATLFVRSKKENTIYNNDLLAFAPVFATSSSQTSYPERKPTVDSTYRYMSRDGRFTPLTYSETEVQEIAALFNERGFKKLHVLLKEEATEIALKKALKDNYRIVHLASHSFSNHKQPTLSGIACALESTASNENGILFSGEIYSMNINSNLLVLSSCESGIGQIIEGEGMLGLNRGFVHAGVPNVIYSLWKVYDQITNELMTEFYDQVLNGDSYASALRTAKLNLLNDERTASPHYWSPFLLIGQ